MKRRKMVLISAAAWLLLMHWSDLYYLVMPESSPAGPPLHLLDLTCFLFVGGVTFALVFWLMGRVHLIPIGDPRLQEAMGLESV